MKQNESEFKERVMGAIIEVFEKQGLAFTMDDIAKHLKISKKTLYNLYDSKEEMLLALADYSFADIKKSEKTLLDDPSIDILDKIKSIIIVLPERYQNIGLSNLYGLKEKFPNVYQKVENYLSTDWNATIYLLEEGMRQGKIRNISIPVVKTMIESTIANFIATSTLSECGLSYEEGLNEMIEIVMSGIVKK